MSEIILKINDSATSSWQEGDCIDFCSDLMIANTNAQGLCNWRVMPRNRHGLMDRDCLYEKYCSEIYQYKFERVSTTQVRRTNLKTNNTDIIGPVPNAEGEAMDVPQYIHRRKQRGLNPLLGDEGSEVWFGGKLSVDVASVGRVWDSIEALTSHLRNDARNAFWPMGRLDIRRCLCLRIDDADTTTIKSFLEPLFEVDNNGDFVWSKEVSPGNFITDTTTNEHQPPEFNGQWQLNIVNRRRRKISSILDKAQILGVSAALLRNPEFPVGLETPDSELGGALRYRTLDMPSIPHTDISKKPN